MWKKFKSWLIDSWDWGILPFILVLILSTIFVVGMMSVIDYKSCMQKNSILRSINSEYSYYWEFPMLCQVSAGNILVPPNNVFLNALDGNILLEETK